MAIAGTCLGGRNNVIMNQTLLLIKECVLNGPRRYAQVVDIFNGGSGLFKEILVLRGY